MYKHILKLWFWNTKQIQRGLGFQLRLSKNGKLLKGEIKGMAEFDSKDKGISVEIREDEEIFLDYNLISTVQLKS